MKPLEQRKAYHPHGFLVQVKVGKKWLDVQGVADCDNTVIAMGGNPADWRKGSVGLWVERDWHDFILFDVLKKYKGDKK